MSETSDGAAMRLTVNFGLPALIYPREKFGWHNQ